MTFDLIAIGESLRDVFYLLDEASVSCSLHKDRCLLCLDFSAKIPVRHIVKVPAAGNSANAAVGASRLGLRTSLVTWIGDDRAGHHITEALTDDRVNLRFLQVDRKHPTSEATILVFKGERTQLVNFQPRAYRLPKLPSTTCIYYSAVGASHDRLDRMLAQELKRHPETRFVFQPGTTHILGGLEKLKPLLAQSFLFILNKDEAHHLLGDGSRPIRHLLESLYAHGAQTVIITDGGNGADAYDGTAHWHMPVFPVTPIEPTGAGDSFATGVTVALLTRNGLPHALRCGTANSWSVIQEIGPQKGLLTKVRMNRVLKKFKKIQPQRQL
ncbi:MAG: carbohydrate kinase family protein [Patescibacteria group bacterium]